MKKVIGILCVFALLIGVASAAMAATPTDWTLNIWVGTSGALSGDYGSLGTKGTATNNKDTVDVAFTYASDNKAHMCIDESWGLAKNDFVQTYDLVTPRTWDIYFFGGASYSATNNLQLRLGGSTTYPVPATTYKCELLGADDVVLQTLTYTSIPTSGTPSSTTNINKMQTVWTIAAGSVPIVDSASAIKTNGLHMRLTIGDPPPPDDVPEPGSMLALGSGLIGLVGFAVRRRR